MEHTRRIAADERESGMPGEARAFDYIKFTAAALVRESNRAIHALEAAALVDELRAAKGAKETS